MKVLGDIEAINLSTGEFQQRVSGDGESVLLRSRGLVDWERLGPCRDVIYGPKEGEPTAEAIVSFAEKIIKESKERKSTMHYRNGREAKNGDKIVQIGQLYLEDGKTLVPTITAVGVLFDAKPGYDYCNGNIAPIQNNVTGACMCDCLHMDDVVAFLTEKGLDKRPVGK